MAPRRAGIGELEALLAGHDFLRVHRSFVVNLDRVAWCAVATTGATGS